MSDRLLSFDSVRAEIRAFTDDEQLYEWLIQVLDKRVPNAKRLPSRWARHAFVSRLYRKSDLLLQARLSRAYSRLLEAFEPRPESSREDRKDSDGDREYLFTLISLSSTIRTAQVKDRLRRWLYLETYRDWEYENFNLHNEILLATSAYDPDDAWLSYIYDTLPTKPYYRRVALASYRAILQTKGIDCLKLLPQVLNDVDPRYEKKRKSFGYLLSLTMSRFGVEVFLDKTTEVLSGSGKGVADACSNVLRLEDFLEDSFSVAQAGQLDSCVAHLRSTVLDPAIERFDKLRVGEKVETLLHLVKKKQPEKIIYLSLDRPTCVLVFPRNFEIGIYNQTAESLLPHLDDYEWDLPLNDSFAVTDLSAKQSMAAVAGVSAGVYAMDEDD